MTIKFSVIQVNVLHDRLRLSTFDKNLLLFIVKYRHGAKDIGGDQDDLRFYQTKYFVSDIKGNESDAFKIDSVKLYKTCSSPRRNIFIKCNNF